MFELTPTSSLSGSVVTVCLQSLKWRRQAVLYSPVLPGIPVTTVTTHYHTRRSDIQHRTRAWHVFLVQSNTFGLHISSLMPSYSIGTLVLSETTTEGLYDLSLNCYLQVFRNSESFKPSPLRQLFGVSLLCLPFYSSAATLLNNQSLSITIIHV